MRLQELRHPLGVGDVPLQAQRQRLDALDDEERVERGDRRAEVAQQLHAGLERERGRAEVLVDHAVVRRVGRGEAGVLPAGPVEPCRRRR